MYKLTKAQQRTLRILLERDNGRTWPNYLTLRRAVNLCFGDVAMVKWGRIWVGIERNGYLHS